MNPGSARLPTAIAVLVWAMLVAIGLEVRPPMPVDETRYLAVAWEMWTSGDYLVPHLNGAPYHHKPPLLFWLMTLGWSVVGVSEIWARLVAPLFGLGCVLLTAHLAGLLFPGRPEVKGIAALTLIGTSFFAIFTTLTFFDCLVAFFTLLGLVGIVTAAQGRRRAGWTLYAIALGLGLLSKGPVQLLHLAPAALLAPLWIGDAAAAWRRWYSDFGLAVLGGVAVGLAWAIPAAIAGGSDFAYMLFFGQTAQRVIDADWHERPFWWYVPLSFLLLFPWLWWPELARSVFAWGVWRDPGVRFCLVSLVPVFLVFSAISGKQPHYIVPLIPLFALVMARIVAAADDDGRFLDSQGRRLLPLLVAFLVGLAVTAVAVMPYRLSAFIPRLAEIVPLGEGALLGGLALATVSVALMLDRARSPTWRVGSFAGLAVVMIAVAHWAVMPVLMPKIDVAPVAAELARAQAENRPVAITFDYHGQYHFVGRLEKPIFATIKDDVIAWARANPAGLIVDYRREDPATYPAQPPFTGRYRGRYVLLWPAAAVNQYGLNLLLDAGERRPDQF